MQGSPRRCGGTWQSPQHDIPARRCLSQEVEAGRAHATSNRVANNGATDGLSDNEAEPGWGVARGRDVHHHVGRRHPTTLAHDRSEVTGLGHPVRPCQHRVVLRGQFGATLATTSGQDGAAGAGTHAKTESVYLRTTPIVRLERSLAHSGISKAQRESAESVALRAGSQLIKGTGLIRVGQTIWSYPHFIPRGLVSTACGQLR